MKVQKLSLGRYLFKRNMFVHKGSILVPWSYILVLKVYIIEPNRYCPRDSFCTFISESVRWLYVRNGPRFKVFIDHLYCISWMSFAIACSSDYLTIWDIVRYTIVFISQFWPFFCCRNKVPYYKHIRNILKCKLFIDPFFESHLQLHIPLTKL